MNDHDIKTMLQNLQRDLRHSPNTLTWQTREFIPEEVREKRVNVLKIISLLGLFIAFPAASYGAWLKLDGAQTTLFYGVVAIFLLMFTWQTVYIYWKWIPRIRENEYSVLDYQIDMKKQKLKILNGNTVQEEHRFQAAPRLPALPLPDTETAHYQAIRQDVQAKISQYTSLKFK